MDAMRAALLLILLCAATACRAKVRLGPDPSLIGQQFVGTLDGSTTRVARLVNTPGDFEYAVHHVDSPAGERLILTRMVGRDEAGRPRYEILAALVPPGQRDDEVLVVSSCSLNGVRDVDLHAIARREPKSELSRIRTAWRATGPAGTLVSVETSGISCEHEGWREP